MSTMKYALVPCKNRETGEVLCYARAVNEVFTFDDLCKQATEETTVTETDVAAVIKATIAILKREVLKGNEIQLLGLGNLFPTYSSEGCDDPAKFTTSLIRSVNLRFRTATDIKKELRKATFTISPTKKLAREAIKKMKEDIANAIDGGGNTDPDGTNG